MWTVLSEEKKVGQKIYVLCRCSCGVEKFVRKTSLFRDSFGCKKCRYALASHRASHSRLYNIWSAMKQRCYYEKSISFNNYGAKGITVCDEWRNDFSVFNMWAEASGYSEDKSIDRIDNSKGYSPENCRWATRAEQSRNTARCINITAFGETMVLKDWCRFMKVNYDSTRRRLDAGWTISEALGIKQKQRKRKSA